MIIKLFNRLKHNFIIGYSDLLSFGFIYFRFSWSINKAFLIAEINEYEFKHTRHLSFVLFIHTEYVKISFKIHTQKLCFLGNHV